MQTLAQLRWQIRWTRIQFIWRITWIVLAKWICRIIENLLRWWAFVSLSCTWQVGVMFYQCNCHQSWGKQLSSLLFSSLSLPLFPCTLSPSTMHIVSFTFNCCFLFHFLLHPKFHSRNRIHAAMRYKAFWMLATKKSDHSALAGTLSSIYFPSVDRSVWRRQLIVSLLFFSLQSVSFNCCFYRLFRLLMLVSPLLADELHTELARASAHLMMAILYIAKEKDVNLIQKKINSHIKSCTQTFK